MKLQSHGAVWRALGGALVFLAFAAGSSRAQDGGTEPIFSTLGGVGSRAIGLGGAFTSLADDGSALYWNPAALRNVQDKQIMAMYMPISGDFADGTTFTYLGAVYPTLSAGAWGIGFLRASSSFEGFDAASVPLGTQDYSETHVLLGYAFERRDGFLMGALASGVNFKIANQQVAGASGTSAGIDLGFRYSPNFAKSLSVGLNFQDLAAPAYKLNVQDDIVPMKVLAGLGYTYVLKNQSALRVMVQADMPAEADMSLHAGVEYAFARYVSLRVGMDDSNITFGLGVIVSSFGLDYAFLGADADATRQPVTFSARWGNSLNDQRAMLERNQAARDQEMIQKTFTARIEQHRKQAKENEAAGNNLLAIDEWKIVLEFVPGDPEATSRIEALNRSVIDEQSRVTRDAEKQAIISTHFSQGLQFYQENDYVGSRGQWRAVLAIDPTHVEAQSYLKATQEKIDEQLASRVRQARQHEAGGRLTQAIGEWNNVQLLDPENAEAKASIERMRRRIESQSQDLQEAANQLRVVTLYDSSLHDFNEGRYSQAMEGCRELLRIQPNHEGAQDLLAMTKRKMTPLTKDEEAAIRSHYLRGMQFFSKDQYQEAIVEWEKILAIDPTNESVKRNVEEAKQRLKQLGRS
jgi:tetratricopeptide (TPR) repeat protein